MVTPGRDMLCVTGNVILARQVQTAPHFVERLSAQTAAEGAPVTLTAEVVGVPTPIVSWSKDGQQLAPPAGDEKRYHIETVGSRVFLRFDGVMPNDAGWYQCTAMNSAGNATSRAKLTVQASTIRTSSLYLSVLLAILHPSVCPSVPPSICLSHAVTVTKQIKLRSCSLCLQIAPSS